MKTIYLLHDPSHAFVLLLLEIALHFLTGSLSVWEHPHAMWATPFRLDSTCLPLHRLAAFEQTILDGIQDLLLVLAPDGRVLHASQMCFALTTLTPKHLLGNHIANFMHYDDREAVEIPPPPPPGRRYLCSLRVNIQPIFRPDFSSPT